ncbi:Di-and tricarboxylate transporter [Rhizobium sp. RU20A]|uniref:SLC13 family permease n=1 Tax=Rhizobium sp. RU20A TaxID=1907412 RepID=UPI00095649BA|nr:SLC13 family permease [Rhizobium sp. RU20A]SIQ99717.1 Di-and tricarboxylate transporter [Rhizobium sp. RU20A]
MTTDQILSFCVIGGMMAVFILDRFRYDLVACGALIVGLLVGIVPPEKAFSGFADDIVIIVGSALVVSAGIARSGVVNMAVQRFFPTLTAMRAQMALLLVTVAFLSAFIKNIGALAIMMPVAFQFARKAGVPPSRYLMPMAFSALLGGLMTQIGTSPNIIVSRVRAEMGGESFTMFDFTAVGLTLTVLGIGFLILFYWLVPDRKNMAPSIEEALAGSAFSSDATVPEGSSIIGKTLSHLLKSGEGDVIATGVLRGERHMTPLPDMVLAANDVILFEGKAESLHRVVEAGDLELSGQPMRGARDTGEVTAVEAVIASDSPLVGLSAKDLSLVHTHGVNLLAVSRRGERLKEKLSGIRLQAGDVVVLQGHAAGLPQFLQEVSCLPLAQRDILLGERRKAWVPLLILAVAIGSTATGFAPVAPAFFAAAVAMIAFKVIPANDAYRSLDGPILVMLAALIPVSDTLRTTGGSDLIAGFLGSFASALPAWGAVALILVTAMAVTPFLNNAATVLVVAPIAASFATGLGYRPEPFLMAVAVGAGCDFLTPIGHQCNTLVMGPGGYRFSDYPRLGLPLSTIIILVGVPTILFFWPAQ